MSLSRRIEVVIAVSENGIIGLSGALPWDIPSEMNQFRQLTQGSILLMGSRTWHSIGRLLPDRIHVVLDAMWH